MLSIEELIMMCAYRIKLKKKQFLNFLVFLSGVGILAWQVWNTFEAFIEGQTTFAVSKKTMVDGMVPPTMIFCPVNDFENGLYTEANASDKDWFFKQFFHLNDNLKMTMIRKSYDMKSGLFKKIFSNLTLGENFDEIGKTFFVEELFNKLIGLCYALTPDESFKMTMKDYVFFLANFKQGTKMPPTDMILTSPEERYEFLFFDLGQVTRFRIPLQAGTTIGLKSQSSIWTYLSSKRNCFHYHEEDSYTHRVLKNQVYCFKGEGPNHGCNCVPYNTHKTLFQMYPINSWNACKSNLEYKKCSLVMEGCYGKVRKSILKPCKKEINTGITLKLNGFKGVLKSNEMGLWITFGTMDIDIQDEVVIQEPYNFIGTVGGSLGLFIGFSYTGFIGQILNYFMHD